MLVIIYEDALSVATVKMWNCHMTIYITFILIKYERLHKFTFILMKYEQLSKFIKSCDKICSISSIFLMITLS